MEFRNKDMKVKDKKNVDEENWLLPWFCISPWYTWWWLLAFPKWSPPSLSSEADSPPPLELYTQCAEIFHFQLLSQNKLFQVTQRLTSLISLILDPPLPMMDPHWDAGTINLRVTGGFGQSAVKPSLMSWNISHCRLVLWWNNWQKCEIDELLQTCMKSWQKLYWGTRWLLSTSLSFRCSDHRRCWYGLHSAIQFVWIMILLSKCDTNNPKILSRGREQINGSRFVVCGLTKRLAEAVSCEGISDGLATCSRPSSAAFSNRGVWKYFQLW